jgi:CBS domain-containing protein
LKTLKKLTVQDAYQLDDQDLIVVKLTDEFSQVIQSFVRYSELRGVFVVDDDNRFAGVITRTDLLHWAQARIGAFFLKPWMNTDETLQLVNLVNASAVEDVLRSDTKKAAVFANETLAHAIKTMIEADLIVLPVVDESRHIIGGLTLSEVLNMTLVES